MKKKIVQLTVIALHLSCMISMLFVVSQGQEKKPAPNRVKFRLSGPKQICLGQSFTLKAVLKNTSRKNVTIRKNGIWRYLTEEALDQSSASVGNIRLDVPKMRSTINDGVLFDNDPSGNTVLRPSQSFVADKLIDLGDRFYATPGRYSIVFTAEVPPDNNGSSGASEVALQSSPFCLGLLNAPLIPSELRMKEKRKRGLGSGLLYCGDFSGSKV